VKPWSRNGQLVHPKAELINYARAQPNFDHINFSLHQQKEAASSRDSTTAKQPSTVTVRIPRITERDIESNSLKLSKFKLAMKQKA